VRICFCEVEAGGVGRAGVEASVKGRGGQFRALRCATEFLVDGMRA